RTTACSIGPFHFTAPAAGLTPARSPPHEQSTPQSPRLVLRCERDRRIHPRRPLRYRDRWLRLPARSAAPQWGGFSPVPSRARAIAGKTDSAAPVRCTRRANRGSVVPYDVEDARTDGVVAAGCDELRLGSGRNQRLV